MKKIDNQSLAEQLILRWPLNNEIDGKPLPYPKIRPSYKKEKHDYQTHVKMLRTLLEQLPTPDRDYAALVSGGIDSTIVACHTNPSKLYTARWLGYDETHYAKIVAKHLGLELKIIDIQEPEDPEETHRIIKELLKANEYPRTGGAGYAYYEIGKKISEDGYKVVVTGDSGDELFMRYGYTRNRFYQLAFAIRHRKRVVQAIQNLTASRKERFYTQIYHENPVTTEYRKRVYKAFIRKISRYKIKNHPDQVMTYLLETGIQNQFNMLKRVLAIHSVEHFTPLYTPEMIEHVSRIPAKICLAPNKKLFKDAAKPRIPKEIYQRKGKTGFGMLPRKWITANTERIKEETKKLEIEAIDPILLDRTSSPATIYYLGQLLEWLNG